ncbi:MAG: rhomboid family intramembrane serine protease [Myxococcota bacterium]
MTQEMEAVEGGVQDTVREAYRDFIEREQRFQALRQEPVLVTRLLFGIILVLFVGAFLFDAAFITERYGINLGRGGLSIGTFFTGMKLPDRVYEGQWWRLISSMFVHLGVMHIAFNGYGLYSIGPMVEQFYGRSRFVVIYLGSGVLSSLASLLFTANASGGASGALYGVVGAMIVFGAKYRADLPARVSKALTRSMLPWVIFGIGIGFVQGVNFDNAAHLGGLISGALLALAMRSRITQTAERRVGDYVVGALAVALVTVTVVALGFWGQEAAQCLPSRDAYVACYPEVLAP